MMLDHPMLAEAVYQRAEKAEERIRAYIADALLLDEPRHFGRYLPPRRRVAKAPGRDSARCLRQHQGSGPTAPETG
jgi:hypothetical protein